MRCGEDGSALALGGSAIAVAVVALVLVVDLTAYLTAFGRARAAADAAALAAVAITDPRGDGVGDAERVAGAVASASGARMEACRCRPGQRIVEVTVSVEVRAVAVTRFAGRRVSATARAHLVRALSAGSAPVRARTWTSDPGRSVPPPAPATRT